MIRTIIANDSCLHVSWARRSVRLGNARRVRGQKPSGAKSAIFHVVYFAASGFGKFTGARRRGRLRQFRDRAGNWHSPFPGNATALGWQPVFKLWGVARVASKIGAVHAVPAEFV